MKKLMLFLLLSCLVFCAQAQSSEERVLYVVDSVAVLDTPPDDEQPDENDIFTVEVVTNADRIKAFGYGGKIDKMIFIITKSYQNRAAKQKLIPTTNNMNRINGAWTLKGSSTPYSGPFVDYFMNGHIQGEGILKDGIIDGVRVVYYLNGQKRYSYTYSRGVENGPSEEYFTNGKLRQRGSFVNKKEVGTWSVYYSTGQLKRQSEFVDHKQLVPKEETKFYALLEKAVTRIKENDFKGAIRKLDDAALINKDYADLYFYRGTAKLESFDFDQAIADFNQALVLEPLYATAIANRAFARLRKYEFKDSRILSQTKEVTILSSKDKVEIPQSELEQICADLKSAYAMGDRVPMIVDAIARYCK